MDLQTLFYIIAIVWMILMIGIFIMIGVFVFIVGKNVLELIKASKLKVNQIQEIFRSSLLKRASFMTLVAPLVSIVAKKMFDSKRR